MIASILNTDFLNAKISNIDIVVTSPPYNIGAKYHLYEDNLPIDEYLEWTDKWISKIYTILNNNGSFFLNLGCKPSNQEFIFQVMNVVLKYFKLQNTFHWIKSIAILNSESSLQNDVVCGHFKPINSDRFVNDCHEYIFHLTKHGDIKLNRLNLGVPYQDKSNEQRWETKKTVRCRGNNWFINYPTIRSKADRPHPASFPEQLPFMCIRLHDVGSNVLDPFMGIGGVALACIKTNKNFIGCEIDPIYCDQSYQSIRAMSAKNNYKISEFNNLKCNERYICIDIQ